MRCVNSINVCMLQFHQLAGCWIPDGVYCQLPKCAGFLLPGRAAEGVYCYLRHPENQQRCAAILLNWIRWVLQHLVHCECEFAYWTNTILITYTESYVYVWHLNRSSRCHLCALGHLCRVVSVQMFGCMLQNAGNDFCKCKRRWWQQAITVTPE